MISCLLIKPHVKEILLHNIEETLLPLALGRGHWIIAQTLF